jgi:hypothetical protein
MKEIIGKILKKNASGIKFTSSGKLILSPP